MSVPSRTTRAGRTGAWFADRPIGVKVGSVVALLAAVVLGTNALAISRINPDLS